MIGEVYTEEGIKKVREISGVIPTGLPVGTWISFEKDQAPDNKWIKAGETFDENLYPALYLFLGTNKVPERFDHNRLGTLTSIAMTANTEITMDYDGVVMFCARRSSSVATFYLNNVQMTNAGGGNSDSWQITIPFKKGDKIKSSQNITVATGVNVDANSCWVAYYSHPMFIKATSAIEITDQNTFLNTVVNTIHSMGSYSTEEVDTGKLWIDGKHIYRKCGLYNNGASTGTGELLLDSSLTSSYVDVIVDTGGCETYGTDKLSVGGYSGYSLRAVVIVKSGGLYKMSSSNAVTYFYWWIEYTKA